MKFSDNIIHVEGLSKVFKVGRNKIHAVSAVDFNLPRGETLGLVGESGCGKSTIGRMILGLEKPTTGKIWFENKELTSMPSNEYRNLRVNIQCIFQDPYSSLNPRISIANSIMEPLNVSRLGTREERIQRVDKLLKMVGIPTEYKNRFPHQFSGGQRQRIGIARALTLNPKVIICDEPVSALDVSIQAQVLNLLSDLQKQLSITYMFISHDLDVVKHISTRICIMYLGRICESGPTSEIFQNPRHPYTKFLIDAVPVSDPRERKKNRSIITGDLPSPMFPPQGCRFHTRCPYATVECKTGTPKTKMFGEQLVTCNHPLEY